VRFGHGVQRTSVLEPLDLRRVEGMRELDLKGRSILGMDAHRQGLSDCQLSAQNVDLERCQSLLQARNTPCDWSYLVIGLN